MWKTKLQHKYLDKLKEVTCHHQLVYGEEALSNFTNTVILIPVYYVCMFNSLIIPPHSTTG